MIPRQYKNFPKTMLQVLLSLMLAILLPAGTTAAAASDLGAQVAALDLGMNGYVIGARLTEAQKEIAAAETVADSYEGTFKFRDRDLFIIAAVNDDTILALYQRNDETNMDGARRIVSGLMGLFGEPTTMAHDKLIYWAYTADGKIPEETYTKLRDDNTPAHILATVKFNSSFEITAENFDPENTGSVYFIITSDPLVREFISRDK
jgi:hypothetical protein